MLNRKIKIGYQWIPTLRRSLASSSGALSRPPSSWSADQWPRLLEGMLVWKTLSIRLAPASGGFKRIQFTDLLPADILGR